MLIDLSCVAIIDLALEQPSGLALIKDLAEQLLGTGTQMIVLWFTISCFMRNTLSARAFGAM